jgi:SAM-dependent methyltransferase
MRRTSRAALLALAVAMSLVTPRSAAPLLAQTPAAADPDVEFVPTPQAVVDAMLDLARVTAADVVYDLGSGDGRVVITAARRYGARGVGIEIDPALVERATASAAAAGVSDRVRFLQGNIFDADISDATVVTLYLLQSLNEKLRPKLVRELKPGTRIVSHVFNMGPEWPPLQSTIVGGHPVYLWTVAPR